MNKKQLVAKLAVSLNQSKADAERTFDTITNTILDALKVLILLVFLSVKKALKYTKIFKIIKGCKEH